MSKRSIWKGPFIEPSFFNEMHFSNKKNKQTQARNTLILPFLIGCTLRIHNGKIFIPICITEEMVGHKLGEFVATRLRHVYKKKNKRNGTKIKSK